jgi:hypothetical protein
MAARAVMRGFGAGENQDSKGLSDVERIRSCWRTEDEGIDVALFLVVSTEIVGKYDFWRV